MKVRALTVVVLMAVLVGESLGDGLTYKAAGKPLGQLLDDLSKLSGSSLKAGASLAKDVVAIRVNAVPLKDLKLELAQIEHGTWVSENGSEVLTLPSKAANEEAELHAKLIRQGFYEALQKEAGALKAQPVFDSASAAEFANRTERALEKSSDPRTFSLSLAALEPLSPSHRAIVRILSEFQPQDFADLPLRIRITYSNLPTSAQRQLPDGAMAAVQTYLEEQTVWAQEASSHNFSSPSRGGASLPLPPSLANRKAPSGTPSKILVSFYRESELGRVHIELKLASDRGEILERAMASIRPKQTAAPAIGLGSLSGVHVLVPSDQALSLTPLKGPAALDQPTLTALQNPERIDPLSLAYGSTLLQLTENEGLNLMAVLSDRLLDAGLREFRYDSSQAYLNLLPAKGQSINIEKGWLEIYPDDPGQDRTDHANRSVLGSYLRASLAGNLSVEDQASYALELPEPMENMMPEILLGHLQNSDVELADAALLRFYGALSEEERLKAQSAEGLPLKDLSSTLSLACLTEIIYARSSPLILPRNSHSELWREPSECLADGLGSQSVLHLSVRSDDSVFDLDQDRAHMQLSGGVVTPAELAFSQYRLKHPEKFPGPTGTVSTRNAAHFQVGELKTYNFAFRFGSNITSNGTLRSRVFSGDRLTVDQLPSSYLDEVSRNLIMVEQDEAKFGGSQPARSSSGSGAP